MSDQYKNYKEHLDKLDKEGFKKELEIINKKLGEKFQQKKGSERLRKPKIRNKLI